MHDTVVQLQVIKQKVAEKPILKASETSGKIAGIGLEHEKKVAGMQVVEERLIPLESNWLNRFLGTVGLELPEVKKLSEQRDKLSNEILTVEASREGLSAELKQAETEILEKTSNIMTPEQKTQFFTTENLASLEMEDYMDVWRAGSPYFVAHITRQGFRDHSAMREHTGGMGQMAGGFEEMLKDGKKLESPFYAQGLKDISPESVEIFMKNNGVLEAENVEEARQRFETVMEISMANGYKWADKTALHLSTEEVLDDHYGCERGNETFVIFPADHIASQSEFLFNGHRRPDELGFSHKILDLEERKWNDIWVWPKDGQGLSLDAGVVFMAKDCPVDPKTGSKYASEEVDGKVEILKNDRLKNEVKTWWTENSRELVGKFRDRFFKFSNYESYDMINQLEKFMHDEAGNDNFKLSAYYQAEGLFDQFRFYALHRSDEMEEGIINYFNDDKNIEEYLGAVGKLYLKPEATVTSEEYWTKYFEEHPQEKPKHVVFYEGNPNVAIKNTLKQYGVVEYSEEADPMLGFGDNLIGANDPEINSGKDDVYRLSEEVLLKHYSHE